MIKTKPCLQLNATTSTLIFSVSQVCVVEGCMFNCHEVSREAEDMFDKSEPLVTFVLGLYIACEPASKLVEGSF